MDTDEGSGFWTTSRIIIVCVVCGVAVLVALVVAVTAIVLFSAQKNKKVSQPEKAKVEMYLSTVETPRPGISQLSVGMHTGLGPGLSNS